jgi:hypothetical protein
MWDNLTPADLDRARHELALERGAMLRRHAAELRDLDVRYDQVEQLNQLIGAFAKKYLQTNRPTESQDEPSLVLQVEQQILPNFGNPIRRLVGR